MNRIKIGFVACLAMLCAPAALATESDELAELRLMIDQMRSDYERRIAGLEQRLAEAERRSAEAPRDAESASLRSGPETSRSGTVSAGTAFNPQTSVILNGNYYHDDIGGNGTEVLSEALQPSEGGHAHGEEGHAHGGMSNGFNLREAEIAFSAAVDPYFDAAAYIVVDGGGNVDLEEAWFQTRSLPYGLKLKGGKFFSDFGYVNNQHPHQWDFANQNLAYLNLLGDHGLQDVGMQVSWLPELPLYTLLGVEVLQGDQERFGTVVDDEEEREETGLGRPRSGPNLWTAFVRFSPDLGYSHALRVGASFAHHRQHQEIHSHGDDHGDVEHDEDEHEEGIETGLEGDADLWGVDLVYKYDNPALYGYRDFKLQAEYLRSIKDLRVVGGEEEEIGSQRKLTTDGLYVQGLYGIAPRWQIALRYDVLGLTNEVSGGANEDFDSSDRWTAAVTWVPTEFSLFRLQYEYSDIAVEPGVQEAFNTFWMQFIVSMGSHGAHRF